MKEDVLDVLMYLFENYMDDDPATEADPETLKTQL
jgi:Smg protein